MKEKFKTLLADINEEKALAEAQLKNAKDWRLTNKEFEYQGKIKAFTSCIKYIDEYLRE